MPHAEDEPPGRKDLRSRYKVLLTRGDSTERTVFFSDAVFAIAMTLLVLDLEVPDGLPPDQVGAALVQQLPHFFSFALSFAVIGSAWLNHHRKFSVIVRYDFRLQVLNLLLLFFVAVLPLPTSLLSEYGGKASPWPVVVYAAVVAGVYSMLNLVWAYAWRAGLMAPAVDRDLYRYVLRALLPVPLVFAASIPVAFVVPGVAMYLWLLIIPADMVVHRIASAQAAGPGQRRGAAA
ncbi:TMEM175 family protein [Arthrobacter agilis]|uniref:TMEM175 family protein n=1 Tax=Arthrobacter agilis TaxID=37921 RepID=UPI00277E3D90|nr:TMEM175 family protein [Arthrobacter agilis]MDQ0735845.1 putative membrane protein [Arthrobacter agilis]